MKNVKQLTDSQLDADYLRARKIWTIGLFMMVGAGVFGFVAVSMGAVMAGTAAFGLFTVGMSGSAISGLRQDSCQAETRSRRMDALARRLAAGADTSLSSIGSAGADFNPAAAAVLEKDMRSMAPLRLKPKSPALTG